MVPTNNTVLTVTDSIDAMLGYWDLELRCRYANSAYKVWFGRSQDEMLGIPMRELLGPLFELNKPFVDSVTNGNVQHFERAIPLPDGSIRHSLASYYPDVSDGTLRGFSVHVADVTAVRLRELKLQDALAKANPLASHDFLTGLPNRVHLEDRIDNAVRLASQDGRLVAVIAIDIDNFRQLNNTYGHHFGDCVLKAIAGRMKSVIRGDRTIKRYGGDEFIFLVPDLRNESEIVSIIASLLDTVCQPLLCEEVTIKPSLSCGVAVFPQHGDSAVTLIKKADKALYEAKKKGKSGVAFANTTFF